MRRAALAAMCVVASSLLLAACGSSTSDADQIKHIITSYGVTPTKLCNDYATPHMIRITFGTKAQCVAAASAQGAADPHVKVDSVTVKGKTATVVRTSESNPGKGTQAILQFIKTGSGWKVDRVLPK